MSPATQVLLVDDDKEMRSWLVAELTSRSYEVAVASSAAEADNKLAEARFDAVVTDLNMTTPADGLALCQRVRATYPDVPVVVVTAFGSIESAVELIQAGAYDYLTKPFDIDVLLISIERAVEKHRLSVEIERLRKLITDKGDRGNGLVGRSDAMREVQRMVAQVASTDVSVLITGESGTGKEVVARTLHAQGSRSDGPFVAVNCAAVSETLLESELFGHERGAFTDAKVSKVGLFLEADRGTLFLDEIGEMPLPMQAKLLRALQERKVRPVGGAREVSFDTRIIAATNRDIEAAVEDGAFREDLYYRINVIHIELPPLRARGADVLLIANHLLKDIASRNGKEVDGIDRAAAEKLLAYPWPGNVRELSNALERAVAVTQFSEVTVEDLPPKIRNHESSHVVVAGDDPTELVPLEVVERRYIAKVLEATGGNKSNAARILGIDRKTLSRKAP